MHHRPRRSECINRDHITDIKNLGVTFFTHPVRIVKMKNELVSLVGSSSCAESWVIDEE